MGGNLSAADQLADDLLAFVNRYGKTEFADVVKRLENGHRTLQQSLMGLFVEVIKANAAKGAYEFDGRNEATVQLCKAIVERCPNEIHLPFI